MCQLKVKVTVKGQIFNKQYYTLCRVRSISPLLMEGFPSNFNDTFISTRGCAEPMLPMCQLKVKVTVKCQILNKQILDFMSCPLYKPYTNEKDFLQTWMTHSSQLGDVQIPCCPCVSSRSRSQLNLYTPKNFIECLVPQVTSVCIISPFKSFNFLSINSRQYVESAC